MFKKMVVGNLEFRKLVCLTKDRSFRHGNETAKCHLVLKDVESEEPGRSAPEGAGCFVVSKFICILQSDW